MKKRISVSYFIAFILVGFTVLSVMVFDSCKKEESGAAPVVTKIRVTTKDSTITAGNFGLTVAIVGQGLQDVTEVWFNDLKAALNPNFVTPNTIICAIPDKLPGKLTNQIKLITKNGTESLVDFKVILPKPVVAGLYNEMAAPGSTTKVVGSAFYFISSVKFGALDATIVSYTPTEIVIKIPAGATPGSLISVTGDGGTTVSTFKYQDPGVILCDFDKNLTSWGSLFCWGGMSSRTDAESINKGYGYIVGTDLPPSSWNNDWVASTCYFDYGYGTIDLTNKVLKFEINAKEPWIWSDAISSADQATLVITLNGSKTYNFVPQEGLAYRTNGFTTNGWMTVTIPFSAFGMTSASFTDFQLVFKTNKQPYSKFSTYLDNFRICTVVKPAV